MLKICELHPFHKLFRYYISPSHTSHTSTVWPGRTFPGLRMCRDRGLCKPVPAVPSSWQRRHSAWRTFWRWPQGRRGWKSVDPGLLYVYILDIHMIYTYYTYIYIYTCG
jgi:hypothetical protein